jgi:hypothetical protein
MLIYMDMVKKKSWEEFRETGLLLFLNSILHAFGWAIVIETDKESKQVTGCYPARVKFRGFSESVTSDAHKKIGNYLKENAEELAKEANE